jgi:hypothetical protein
MSYSYGHIPDAKVDVEADLRHRHIAGLIGRVAVALPAFVDFSSLVGPIPDQGASSSCVGNAFSTSVLVRSDIAGHRVARPSRKAIYDVARLVDQPRQPLVDEGSMPRAAAIGMLDYGLVAEDRWPLTDANVNDAPPLDVFQHGLGAMIGGYYRIGSGPGCALLIRQALAKGFAPCFALQVDQAFEDYESGVYGAVNGSPLGGHYLCAVAYGDGWIRVCNSWGIGWGESGFVRIADEVFDSDFVSDVLTVTVVPLAVS